MADTGAAPGGMPADGPAPLLLLGVVAAAHGIAGAVRVRAFTETPEALGDYGPVCDADGTPRYRLRVVGDSKGMPIVRVTPLDGPPIGDRDAAERLVGAEFWVPRDRLPAPEDADEFYHADLIGCAARLADGTLLGHVQAIHDFGAGDVLELEDPRGKPVVIPFTRAVVPDVDPVARCLTVVPPEGLLDPPGQHGAGKRKGNQRRGGKRKQVAAGTEPDGAGSGDDT